MDNRDFPEPLEALVLILVTFGFIFGVVVIITLMAILLRTESVLEGNSAIMFIIGGLIFLIIPITYAKMRGYNTRRLFRLNLPPAEVTLLTIPIGISIGILIDELDRIIQIFIPTPEIFLEYLKSLRAETPLDWILLILGVVIIAAASEEILFRGFLQVSLERKGDITKAVIFSSVAWTVIHINPYWAIQIFVSGVLIGFLAWRTNSILPAIIVHGINNLISLIFINLEPELSMDWYLLGGHVSPVVIVIAAGILYLSIKRLSGIYQNN